MALRRYGDNCRIGAAINAFKSRNARIGARHASITASRLRVQVVRRTVCRADNEARQERRFHRLPGSGTLQPLRGLSRSLPRGQRGSWSLVLAGDNILSADPTAVAALEPATSAEADDGTLRIKRAVVDTIPGHGIDLLGVRHVDVLRRCRTRRHASDDYHCKS
jgi:hypothetical protein